MTLQKDFIAKYAGVVVLKMLPNSLNIVENEQKQHFLPIYSHFGQVNDLHCATFRCRCGSDKSCTVTKVSALDNGCLGNQMICIWHLDDVYTATYVRVKVFDIYGHVIWGGAKKHPQVETDHFRAGGVIEGHKS